MEREKFEESWKDAFDKAEVAPSDSVWTNVELDLEKARGGDLKKRLLFYQMLAAASVVFAMAVGGIGYYNVLNSQTTSGDLALQGTRSSDANSNSIDQTISPSAERNDLESRRIPPEDAAQNQTAFENSSSNQTLSQTLRRSADRGAGDQTTDDIRFIQGPPKDANTALAAASWKQDPELMRTIDDRNLPPFYTARKIELKIPEKTETVDPVVAMLARLEQREEEVRGEGKDKNNFVNTNENLWTSIGFAAGTYNSVQSAVPGPRSAMSMAMAMNAPIVEQETKASGYSYSMGVNVGTRIAERWVFQGGVNYLTHSSQYVANNVVASSGDYQQQRFRTVSTNELLRMDAQDVNNKIVYSAPYNVNNNMRYLSIPMQAGYLLVNKTFGLQLNAGVATDLFLQNTVTADSDQLDDSSQPVGSESPYRTVNLSGLMGTEVSYRFGEHYRVSLNPGIRYPFNTIYKSEVGVQSAPLTFDVGLRFRYIFH